MPKLVIIRSIFLNKNELNINNIIEPGPADDAQHVMTIRII